MVRLRPFFAIAAAALVLAACSFTKLAYMNAALAYSTARPVLAYMVADYVEMTDPQRAWVNDRLARALEWHRARELPEYERFMEWAAINSRDGITVDEARRAHGELRGYYQRLVEHMLPDIADFALQLDERQLARLDRKFADDNRKIARDSVKGTPEDRRDERVKRYLEHIEAWTGRLDPAQRSLVARHVGDLPDLVDERLGDRRYRQAEFLALARARPPREKMVAELRRLLIDTDSWRRPDYVEKLRARDERLFAMIAALSATLDASQKAHLDRKARGVIHDLSDLIASSHGGAAATPST